MSLLRVVVVVTVCVFSLVVALPQTQWHPYGYGPSGVLSILLLVFLVLLMTDRL